MHQRMSHSKMVDMSNRNLKTFNYDLFVNVLKHIDSKMFDIGLNTSTEEINLSHNNLKTTDGFTPLKLLLKLDLSFNKISNKCINEERSFLPAATHHPNLEPLQQLIGRGIPRICSDIEK